MGRLKSQCRANPNFLQGKAVSLQDPEIHRHRGRLSNYSDRQDSEVCHEGNTRGEAQQPEEGGRCIGTSRCCLSCRSAVKTAAYITQLHCRCKVFIHINNKKQEIRVSEIDIFTYVLSK